ncbi:MAG: M14 family zinc carboxypeptidase [Promethearchaeota archaeon]
MRKLTPFLIISFITITSQCFTPFQKDIFLPPESVLYSNLLHSNSISSLDFSLDSSPNSSQNPDSYKYMWEEYINASGNLLGDDILQYGSSFGPFHNYSEIQEKIFKLNQSFPDIIDIEIIGRTFYNRAIYAVHITDESSFEANEKEEMLVISQHHAREQITVENALYLIDQIIFTLQNPQNSQNSQNLSNFLWEVFKHRILTVIPTLNADGASIIHRYPFQRKTLRPYDEDGDGIQDEIIDGNVQIEALDMNGDGYIHLIMDSEMKGVGIRIQAEGVDLDGDGLIGEDAPGGVDPNRNYPYDFGNPYFSSDIPSSQMYSGEQALSENCTRVLSDYIEAHEILIAVSLHSGIYNVFLPGYSVSSMHVGDDELYLNVSKSIYGLTGVGSSQMSVSAGMWTQWMYYMHTETRLILNIELFGNPMGYFEDEIESTNQTKVYGIWDMFNPAANKVLENCELWFPVFCHLLELEIPHDASLDNVLGQYLISGTDLGIFSLIGLVSLVYVCSTIKHGKKFSR